MSTPTIGLLDAILVSDLPPVREHRDSLATRVLARVAAMRQERAFERALRTAAPGEAADLIAAVRRS